MKNIPEEYVSMTTQRIVKNQAYRHYQRNWVRLKRWCCHEDLVQVIYERLLRDDLLKCEDCGLVYVVANRACIDFCRSAIPGHRSRKGLTIVEYEDEAVKIFDSHHHEIMSLNELMAKLPDVQKIVVKKLIENHTLKEIGTMLSITESRICQIRKKLIGRLIQLYQMEGKKWKQKVVKNV